MLLSKQKKAKGNRVLITVNVLGSAGPLRFVVNEGELVAAVIDMALKSYAREGRLPVLGSNLNDFLLHCPSAGSDALSPLETIGAHGTRNFLLCKKPQPEKTANVEVGAESASNITRRGNGSWKSWINKTIILKIASH
ncbi:uncharacterized protein At4g22758-like [Chenopodium quinoa]|uniref:DUF7054 domain-containing protein n=1 Tax=Chenopodium quinoa TaxID=63459 RepID=A0A803LJP3_CHEQI|nr:uncharacterized protein At4g22758-like [Chenopodium quinoa]